MSFVVLSFVSTIISGLISNPPCTGRTSEEENFILITPLTIKSFERKLDGGWIAFGEIDSPPDGVGNQGVVLLRDIADVATRAQSISSNNGGGVVLSDASVDCESSSEDDNIMQW